MQKVGIWPTNFITRGQTENEKEINDLSFSDIEY
jgi:hypothetical protein